MRGLHPGWTKSSLDAQPHSPPPKQTNRRTRPSARLVAPHHTVWARTSAAERAWGRLAIARTAGSSFDVRSSTFDFEQGPGFALPSTRFGFFWGAPLSSRRASRARARSSGRADVSEFSRARWNSEWVVVQASKLDVSSVSASTSTFVGSPALRARHRGPGVKGRITPVSVP